MACLKKTKKYNRTVFFLTLIVSEEERRHMIECKIFAIMAKIFSLEDVDIARNSIKKYWTYTKNIKTVGNMSIEK